MVRLRRVAFHTRAGLRRPVSITVPIRDGSMTFEEFHQGGLTRDVDTGRLFRKP
jgi:hypothetical protein